MAYITEYYFDIKLTDKTSPVKRRLEIFRRSTHEHLMSVPAANIPNDGIFVTTNLVMQYSNIISIPEHYKVLGYYEYKEE